jgi:hypothetical protein
MDGIFFLSTRPTSYTDSIVKQLKVLYNLYEAYMLYNAVTHGPITDGVATNVYTFFGYDIPLLLKFNFSKNSPVKKTTFIMEKNPLFYRNSLHVRANKAR